MRPLLILQCCNNCLSNSPFFRVVPIRRMEIFGTLALNISVPRMGNLHWWINPTPDDDSIDRIPRSGGPRLSSSSAYPAGFGEWVFEKHKALLWSFVGGSTNSNLTIDSVHVQYCKTCPQPYSYMKIRDSWIVPIPEFESILQFVDSSSSSSFKATCIRIEFVATSMCDCIAIAQSFAAISPARFTLALLQYS